MTTSVKIWIGILGMMLLALGRPQMWARDSVTRGEGKWWQNAVVVVGAALMVVSSLRFWHVV